MDIKPQCRLNVCVPQHFRETLYIYAVVNTARGVGMPDGVKIAVFHTAAFQQCMEPALTGARLHRLIHSARQNIRLRRGARRLFLQKSQHVRRNRHGAHGVLTFGGL